MSEPISLAMLSPKRALLIIEARAYELLERVQVEQIRDTDGREIIDRFAKHFDPKTCTFRLPVTRVMTPRLIRFFKNMAFVVQRYRTIDEPLNEWSRYAAGRLTVFGSGTAIDALSLLDGG